MAKQARTKNVTATSDAAETVDISSADHTFANAVEALYVGGAGDVVMRGRGDDADSTWKNVQAGSVLPFAPSKIVKIGTTATFMLGLL